MIKHLTAIGNSLGLIIERPILDLLRIERDTPLEVRTDGEALIVRPVREDHPRRVLRSAMSVIRTHDATLRRLGP